MNERTNERVRVILIQELPGNVAKFPVTRGSGRPLTARPQRLALLSRLWYPCYASLEFPVRPD